MSGRFFLHRLLPTERGSRWANKTMFTKRHRQSQTVMSDISQNIETTTQRCFQCLRPVTLCYCGSIPDIQNRTEVLIIQDRRERFHPFNTARMVQRALKNSMLFVDRTRELAKQTFPFRAETALLYPGPNARLLTDMPESERPKQIVAIDGTWHHAKQIFKELPCLHSLPQFMIAPERPGNFRIRREPNDQALSTVEAIVAALKTLEPETAGFDELIAVFTKMVDTQIAHPKSVDGKRFNRKRKGTPFNIPFALISNPENILVVYGESISKPPSDSKNRKLLYWVATRLGSEEVFARTISYPGIPVDEKVLSHMDLAPASFDNSISPEQFKVDWANFLRQDDVMAAYQKGTFELLKPLGLEFKGQNLIMKSVDLKNGFRNGHLQKLLSKQNVDVGPSLAPGRAGRRLAGAVALARYLAQVKQD